MTSESPDIVQIEAPAVSRRIAPDEIHETIRDRICLLEYAPGSLLREAALAAEFGVSRTPIREIMQRLAQEGLVESRNGVGTLVRPLDFDGDRGHLRDAPQDRAADRRAFPRPVFASHIARTEALLGRARAIATDFDLREYWNINHDLHFIVGELIGNVALAEMWDRFYFQAARMWYRPGALGRFGSRPLPGARGRGHAGSAARP